MSRAEPRTSCRGWFG